MNKIGQKMGHKMIRKKMPVECVVEMNYKQPIFTKQLYIDYNYSRLQQSRLINVFPPEGATIELLHKIGVPIEDIIGITCQFACDNEAYVFRAMKFAAACANRVWPFYDGPECEKEILRNCICYAYNCACGDPVTIKNPRKEAFEVLKSKTHSRNLFIALSCFHCTSMEESFDAVTRFARQAVSDSFGDDFGINEINKLALEHEKQMQLMILEECFCE